MSIFLSVLKILLFIIIGILGLLVLLLLLVLLVPLRYRGEGSYHGDEPDGVFKASWLLHIISGRIDFSEDKPAFSLRLFGIPLKNGKTEEKIHTDKKPSGKSEEIKTEKSESPGTVGRTESPESKDAAGKTENTGEGGTEKEPFIDRVNEGWQETKEKILRKIDGLREKADDLRLKLRFIQNERTEKAVRFLWKKVIKVLKHVLPGKISGQIRYGLKSPDQTGMVLGLVSMLIPLHKNRIRIEPDFTDKIFEGDIRFRGKIRIGYLACQAVAVLLNKNCRVTYKRYKKYFSENKEVKNG